MEAVFERNSNIIEKFITKYIEPRNNIITDGWSAYNIFNNNPNYNRIPHNQGGGDFGYGIQYTSHIESLWSQLKGKIKSSYHAIPNKHIIHFVKESEYKYKLRSKTKTEKITHLFEAFQLIRDVSDIDFSQSDFLTDEALNGDQEDDNNDNSLSDSDI